MIEEIDYGSFLKKQFVTRETITAKYIKCENCSAIFSINLASPTTCSFCASPLITGSAYEDTIIKPKSILPFNISIDKANEEFRKWIEMLRLAPDNLYEIISLGNFTGIYIPYWTYGIITNSEYTGEKGIYYYENESYTTTENGKTVAKNRRVKKIRWYSAKGSLKMMFDDVLISATKSLPEKYIKKLEPWDLENLVPFRDIYLNDYKTEKYQVNLEEGFEAAKKIATPEISLTIMNKIGGDEQRIFTVNTQYTNITFKHLLLPIYTCAYNYNGKKYQFLVNARTGEVQGQRPYSWIKITILVVLSLIEIALVIYLYMYCANKY
ncbi:hypothetical protein [Flavobacterium sp. MK4S-17]|uniref:hypothetical protein n=1 Tax=Flavobacterium sp. MK4S-17 TaxID=2543737 RepID=UPI00135B0668|nr:hypothetical protein [Flavobacterium sp. MK4S-17]